MQDVAYTFNPIVFNFFIFVKYSQHTIILYCLRLKEVSLAGGQGFVLCFGLSMPH